MKTNKTISQVCKVIFHVVGFVATVAVIANLGFAPQMIMALTSQTLALFVAASATSYYLYSVTTAFHRARFTAKSGTMLLSAVPAKTFLAETAAFLLLVVPIKGTVLSLYLGTVLVRSVA